MPATAAAAASAAPIHPLTAVAVLAHEDQNISVATEFAVKVIDGHIDGAIVSRRTV